MENKIEIFKNEELGEVRTLFINGECWFVGKDVANCLKYTDTDQAIRKHVFEEDKLTRKIDGAGQGRNMIVINESGMYSLIFGSELKTAQEFKRWVTKEVLPSIRKHGLYITDELLENQQLLEDKISELRYNYKMLKEEKEKIETKNKEYRLQSDAVFRLSIKTGQDESYLPDLALQIIREYVSTHEEIIIEERENTYIVNKKPLMKELNKLILRKEDIIYVLGCLRIRIEDNYMYIMKEFLKQDYIPISFCL